MNQKPKDPLHGKTLEMILKELVDFYGWEQLGNMITIRCFTHDPSIKSSLTFLRKTPWARTKVENLYLYMLEQL
ncbi:VF530 family DNA-binding protein [Peredibacter sp. HCB2-198]|uniref:VF530 family protein n=1 Tax=Peredibacter sp. HCB2-198 TaxID=3383025 RepID=UPI0038B60DE1